MPAVAELLLGNLLKFNKCYKSLPTYLDNLRIIVLHSRTTPELSQNVM